MEKTVEDRVSEILFEQMHGGALTYNSDEIKPESSLAEDLGFDSLDLVETVMTLEEQFDITITDEEAEAVSDKTFADVVTLVKKKLEEK